MGTRQLVVIYKYSIGVGTMGALEECALTPIFSAEYDACSTCGSNTRIKTLF